MNAKQNSQISKFHVKYDLNYVFINQKKYGAKICHKTPRVVVSGC